MIMDEFITGAGAGGGGIVGVFLAWLGFKSKICSIEKRLDSISKNVRYEITCDKIHEATNRRLKSIEDMLREIRDNIRKE